MTHPEQRKDSIAEKHKEILRIVLATAKNLQDVIAIVKEVDNISEVGDRYKKLSEIRDRLQVIADNETDVMNGMKCLLRRN